MPKITKRWISCGIAFCSALSSSYTQFLISESSFNFSFNSSYYSPSPQVTQGVVITSKNRHSLLILKEHYVQLSILQNHSIKTRFSHGQSLPCKDQRSSLAVINASVVRGSVIGPSDFIISTADLQPTHRLEKYADDSYLLIGSKHVSTVQAEL